MTPKIWGATECVMRTDAIEVHRIRVTPGGYCSVHRHRKLNKFYVLSGELAVYLFDPDKLIPLGPGQEYTIPSMRWHQFRAATAVEAIEIYTPAPLDPEDIERRSEGGLECT